MYPSCFEQRQESSFLLSICLKKISGLNFVLETFSFSHFREKQERVESDVQTSDRPCLCQQ